MGFTCFSQIALSSGDINSTNLSCFSYFSTKTYVVGAQKNSLNERVLFGSKTSVKIHICENYYNFTLKCFYYLDLCYMTV